MGQGQIWVKVEFGVKVMSKVKVVVKVNVCVCGCIWLRQMSLLIAPMAPLADLSANIIHMSLTTRIQASKQARQVNIKDLKRG